MDNSEYYNTPQSSIYDEWIDKYIDELNIFDRLLQDLGLRETEGEEIRNIDMAWRAISRYCWFDYDDADALAKCKLLVVELARAYYINNVYSKKQIKGQRQIIQESLGSRSVTFGSGFAELDSNGLTVEVKAALPPRKLRVI